MEEGKGEVGRRMVFINVLSFSLLLFVDSFKGIGRCMAVGLCFSVKRE